MSAASIRVIVRRTANEAVHRESRERTEVAGDKS